MVILTFLLNLIVFILVLGIIILLHELGHFFVAKKFNVLCHEFSVGMGPALFQKKKGETTYSVRAVPIGGYVSIAGEDNDDSLFTVDDIIGLRITPQNEVEGIVLDEMQQYDVIGKVVSFEIFDKDKTPLHVELELEDGTVTKYPVLEDCKYYLPNKKEVQIATKERSLSQKPKIQRFLVLFAGAFMNFVLAIFLFILAYSIIGRPVNAAVVGKVDPNGALAATDLKDKKNFKIEEVNGVSVTTWDDLSEEIQKYPGLPITIKVDGAIYNINTRVDINMLGVSNYFKEGIIGTEQLVIGQVYGLGDKSGLQPGDKITKINKKEVTTWEELISELDDIPELNVKVSYLRDGVEDSTSYKIMPKETIEGQGAFVSKVLIGIEGTYKFDFGYALKMGFVAFGDDATKIFKVLGGLFTPKTSGISVTDLAGPIGIFNLVSQVRQGGFVSVLLFMAFLSVNVGLVNLLPIPALDGGRILFLLIEAVTRRPLNKKVETLVNNITFILLLALFALIMVFDVLRLF